MSQSFKKKPHGKPVKDTTTIDTTVITPTTLPAFFQITMPAVQDQGTEGSCVPFAVFYYMGSVEFKTVLSPEWAYDQLKQGSCADGSSLIGNLNFFFTNGTVSWNTLPYTSGSCDITPTQAQITEAQNYRTKGYRSVYSSDSIAIKTLLSTGHPLAFTFTADANFYYAGPGYVWRSYSPTIYAPHCITLCGYDDSKKAYRAVNQWGTAWGDNGYIWIEYDFFSFITQSAFTINI